MPCELGKTDKGGSVEGVDEGRFMNDDVVAVDDDEAKRYGAGRPPAVVG
jgi:hypothetical protein